MAAPLPVVALYQKCKARVSGLTKPASDRSLSEDEPLG